MTTALTTKLVGTEPIVNVPMERRPWWAKALRALRLRSSDVVTTYVPVPLHVFADSQPSPFSVKGATGRDTVSRNEDGKPHPGGIKVADAVKHGMMMSVWVYACVRKVAEAIASLPMVVEDGNGDPQPNSILQGLLDKPNGFWSQQDLVERLASHLMLSGNAIITENRGTPNADGTAATTGVPLELWAISPDAMKPVASKSEYISGWVITVDGKSKPYPKENVIHIQLTNPADPRWGLSPLIAASQTVELEKAAIAWNRNSMENRAVADGMLSFGADLTREQWIEARYQLREQHMGSANARIPMVFGNDATWRTISMTPVEMDFIKSRLMTREEICAVFGVPPILVGILDRATYSNFETAREAFWSDTIVPLMVNITDALTLGFRRDFGDVVVNFDTSDNAVLNAVKAEVVKIAKDLWGMGVPFDQLNARLGMGFSEFAGWDQSYIPSSVVPADLMAVDREAMLGVGGNDDEA